MILRQDYNIINSKLTILKAMTEKSSLKMAIQGENANDWKHFYGTDERSSPPELASGPLLHWRKDASAQAVILMKRTRDT